MGTVLDQRCTRDHAAHLVESVMQDRDKTSPSCLRETNSECPLRYWRCRKNIRLLPASADEAFVSNPQSARQQGQVVGLSAPRGENAFGFRQSLPPRLGTDALHST